MAIGRLSVVTGSKCELTKTQNHFVNFPFLVRPTGFKKHSDPSHPQPQKNAMTQAVKVEICHGFLWQILP